MTRTNILILGYGRTGSHALVDLLSEYNNISVFPGEFDDFRASGLIADQLDPLMSRFYPNQLNIKIDKYHRRHKLMCSFVPNNFQDFTWVYGLLRRFKNIERLIQYLLYRKSLIKINNGLGADIDINDKFQKVIQWVKLVGKIYCSNDSNKEFILFDQPIKWNTDPEIWMKVLKPFKMICSIRNPKDQLANLVKDGHIFKPYGAPFMNWGGNIIETLHGRTRRHAIMIFIQSIKIYYSRLLQMTQRLDNQNFLIIRFEDLIKSYDETKWKIENFIGGIENHHDEIRKYFDPEISVKNLDIYSSLLDTDEIDMIKELDLLYKDLQFKVKGFMLQ